MPTPDKAAPSSDTPDSTDQPAAENTPEPAAAKPTRAEKPKPITFECTRYPSLCVWRTDADGKPLEPLIFSEPVGDDGYVVLRPNKHGDPYRCGTFTTSDPDEIAALDALAASYDVSRA